MVESFEGQRPLRRAKRGTSGKRGRKEGKLEVGVVGDGEGEEIAGDGIGLAFGAERVYGVLTGCHDGEQLDSAGATAVLYSAADLFSLLGN